MLLLNNIVWLKIDFKEINLFTVFLVLFEGLLFKDVSDDLVEDEYYVFSFINILIHSNINFLSIIITLSFFS
jgi:hypothetical protein